jgi:L-ribulose-5-phosphate 3-epimerase
MFILGTRVHDYGRGEILPLFTRIANDGFKTVQLAYKKAVNGVSSIEDITPKIVDETLDAMKKTGISIGVLGSYVELSMCDEAERKKAADEFIAMLPIAKKLGAHCIASETTHMANNTKGATRADAVKQLKKSLSEIMPVAESLGVTVAVEPVFYHAMNTPEQTRDVLDSINSPNLKVLLDPVNILSPDFEYNQTDMWQRAFKLLKNDVVAVHMKGVHYENDVPVSVPFAKSIVDYKYLFDEMNTWPQTMPVMREEVKPETAKEDVEFLKALM